MGSLAVRSGLLGLAGLVAAVLFAFAPLASAQQNYLVTSNIVYGDPSRPDREFQSLDIYWQDNVKKRPVIIYIHDGGWALGDKSDVGLKPQFFADHDMSFISMNYRLRWDYNLYDQVEDIVSVIRWVKANHGEYGLDPGRIVLMGHGAGAHLASLVGTNEEYLRAGRLSLSDIKSIVSIDTASFDIPRLMNETGSYIEQRRHRLIFGEVESVWAAASPITYVKKGKKHPSFALLYVADSESTASQARDFARALREAETNVIMIPGNHKTTQTINDEIGSPRDAPSLALIAFIRATI